MSAFTNLNDALRAMKTDPSTARDPIKRMFLCDGQFITANASIIEDRGNALIRGPRTTRSFSFSEVKQISVSGTRRTT
ncbi:MAG TPA: hypothetical protein VFH01_03680 [Pyrinomonadaceae bacterium]|nr:hypothetical protein [Pyrinomonadaceae bacterium]